MKKSSVGLKVNKEKKLFIFTIMILITIISFILVFKTELFSVKYVEVLGIENLTKEIVVEEAGINFGGHILKEDLENIKLNVEYDPYVKSALVERRIPNKIVINIEERKEKALINFMDTYLIIDEEGVVLRSSFNRENLILIKGIEFDNFVEGEKLSVKDEKQFKYALHMVDSSEKNGINLKEINVSDLNDVKININGYLICNLGSGEELDRKLNTLRKIIKDLEKKDIVRGIVDMSHNGYPTYRPIE
ncbi:cell division protein FtsQ/DivIB [Anaeromicrobium sediminis]|nr:FtsQ-type POTRA domain-containing protein [Anaeromicrobium sediminis]